MVRFLHTGDWQLGMTRRFLSDEAQARFSAARLDAVRAIGALAGARRCDFVVCAGDVFEHNALDRQVVVRALEAMADCPVPLYLLPGNHDPLDAGSVYRSQTFLRHVPAQVVVLDGAQVHQPIPGVEVHGAPWTSKRPLADLVAGVCERLETKEGTLRVLVAHGAIDRGAPDPDDPALIGLAAVEQRIADGCMHYLALGDRHSLTEVGASGRVRYAGAPEPTDFDEVDPGKVIVVDLEAGSCAVETVQVGTWRFLRRRVDLSGPQDVAELTGWLAGQPDKGRAIVRLSLVGTLSLRDAAALDEALEHHRDLFASVEVWDPASDLAVLPDDVDFTALDLAGFAAETVEELRGRAAGSGVEATRARDALALLYRLVGAGESARP
jgi:DNA repair exonuclease SbcCD nuclease subunit